MKKQLLVAGLTCGTLLAIAAAGNNDPVLMKVAGKDIRLSEFEYLFHKNNSQELQQHQPIEKYVEMFIDYKLKVADAEAAGLDTTKAFRDEFVKFRNELSQPYLRDNNLLDSLINVCYGHMAEEVLVSHIMLPVDQVERIDSLRNAIVSGQTTFEDAARQYSIDKYSAVNGGMMGVVVPSAFPWNFEQVAYATPVGKVSEVVNSGLGQHLIRVEKRTPSRGEVNVEHILRLTQGKDAAAKATQKQLIDSIYTVVSANPEKFEELARQLSEDPGSAKKGGALGWFGSGRMVQEFDSVSFALPVGAISQPFATSYGWHIVKKLDSRTVAPLADIRKQLEGQLSRNLQGVTPESAFIERCKAKYNGGVDEVVVKGLAQGLTTELDSVAIADFKASNIPVFYVGKNKYTLAEALKVANVYPGMTPAQFVETVRSAAYSQLNDKLLDMARQDLYNSNPDYRNIVNEYHDGILLFEVSNGKIWDKAAKDTEGLEAFFNANRDKYRFEAPKFKSYIFFANNDSILEAALQLAEQTPADIAPADLVKAVRDKFGRDVKIERVLAAKGENAYVDHVAFGGVKPEAKSKGRDSFAAFRGRTIDAPEGVADVRNQVISDYQSSLEKQWLSQLRKNYKFKVNKKILKQVK